MKKKERIAQLEKELAEAKTEIAALEALAAGAYMPLGGSMPIATLEEMQVEYAKRREAARQWQTFTGEWNTVKTPPFGNNFPVICMAGA